MIGMHEGIGMCIFRIYEDNRNLWRYLVYMKITGISEDIKNVWR